MRAVGVLGGSFDPVHYGHLALARSALRHFSFDPLLLIPAGAPPHKSQTVNAPPRHRLAMLKRAVAETGLSAEVRDSEMVRAGPSYTIDTLYALRAEFPGREICFVIGSDNLAEIITWHRWREILPLTIFCVAHRPGYDLVVPPDLAMATIRPFPSPEVDISSSEIRRRLRAGESCENLAPKSVLAYIREHGLYRGDGG